MRKSKKKTLPVIHPSNVYYPTFSPFTKYFYDSSPKRIIKEKLYDDDFK
jgi:hypothetical protein